MLQRPSSARVTWSARITWPASLSWFTKQVVMLAIVGWSSTLILAGQLKAESPSGEAPASRPLTDARVDDQLDGDALLAADHIVEIQIKLSQSDWQTLCNQAPNGAAFMGGDVTKSNYTYFKGDIWIDGEKIKNVGIRKKGFFGSNDGQRPSLKIKFDEFKKKEPIRGLDRLTLNNNKQDKSLLSQFLAYQIFRKAGVVAPRSNFAKVTVNDQYLGVYSNVESIKTPFLKNNFGNSDGALYEGALTDFHPRASKNIEAKNKAADDRSRLNRLTDLLAEEGDLDVEQLRQLIDLDQFLKYWATESLLGFWDGYNANQNNYYVYFSLTDNKARFIPWGADWVFTANGPFGGFGAPTSVVNANSILANRLYRSPGIAERYQQATNQVLENAWNEQDLLNQIDQMEKLLSPHLGPTQRDVPQAMQQLRDFIQQRPQVVTEALAEGPVDIPEQPRKPAYQISVGNAKGTFSTQWAVTGPDLESDTQLALVLDDKALDFESVQTTIAPMPPMGGFGFGRRPGGFGGGFGGGGFGGPGGNAEPPKLVNLQWTGTDESGDSTTITLTLNQDDLKSDSEMQVNGRLTQRSAQQQNQRQGFGGPPFGGFGFGGPNRSVSGTLVLKEIATEEGAKVSGSFDLTITESRGGMFGGPPPGGFGGRRGGGFNRGGFGGGRRGGFNQRPGGGSGGFGPPNGNRPRPDQRQDDDSGDEKTDNESGDGLVVSAGGMSNGKVAFGVD